MREEHPRSANPGPNVEHPGRLKDRPPMSAKLDRFATDVLHRCRWALAHTDGHPLGAWSTGEQLAVALVLRDRQHLAAMDYTPQQAAERVAGGMWNPPADMNEWLAAIRIALARD
jgi:hypothetical protein